MANMYKSSQHTDEEIRRVIIPTKTNEILDAPYTQGQIGHTFAKNTLEKVDSMCAFVSMAGADCTVFGGRGSCCFQAARVGLDKIRIDIEYGMPYETPALTQVSEI